MTVEYLELSDYLAIAAAVTGLDVTTLTHVTRLSLADSALHASAASFDALLAEVEAALERAQRSSPGWPAGRHVVSVSCRRSGQEAELVVDFADIVDGDLEYLRTCFPVHAYVTHNGDRLPVSVIASIVTANVEEPVRRSLP